MQGVDLILVLERLEFILKEFTRRLAQQDKSISSGK